MKEKKAHYYTQVILKTLLKVEMITINQLAEEVGLSEKTVRTKIEDINDYLKAHDLGEIVKKRRIGVWLKATSEQKVKIQNVVLSEHGMDHLQSDQTRMYIALRHILTLGKYSKLTTNQLADKMYLSAPTALKALQDCVDWLKLFDIELKIVRRKGIELNYKESQYRIAIKHFILRFEHAESLDEIIHIFMPNLNLEKVKKSIIHAESEWGFEFAEESFNEIYVYLALSVYRQSIGKENQVEILDNDLRMLQTYNEYSFAESIMKKAKEYFDIELTEAEIGFLSIPILCSKMIDPGYSAVASDVIHQYDNKLQEFVRRIIDVVSSVLNVDLSKDETLFNGLLIHMKPTIFRLRYEKTQANRLKGYIKSEFKQAFRVSWLISVLFEEYFDLTVTEEELSYITLYIQSALERNEQPINTVLVTKTSMGVNQMLCDKIKRNFTKIQKIKVVSIHEFNIDNYASAHMIITTQKLDSNDVRIVEVDELLSESSIRRINHQIRSVNLKSRSTKATFDPICHSLFEPDLIFTHLKIDNKIDLLNHLVDKLVSRGYVTKKYINTVLDREEKTPTSIGNMVAIPHGDQSEINEPKIVIATLEEPILWDDEMVDVVFLLCVKMTNEFEMNRTQLFYKQYIHLVDSDQEVNVLRSFKTSTDFYRYLIN